MTAGIKSSKFEVSFQGLSSQNSLQQDQYFKKLFPHRTHKSSQHF